MGERVRFRADSTAARAGGPAVRAFTHIRKLSKGGAAQRLRHSPACAGSKADYHEVVKEKKSVLIQAALVLLAVWAAIIGVRTLAGSQRATAERISQTLVERDFADWSGGSPAGTEPDARHDRLREVAELFNRLDFNERQKARDQRVGEEFFGKLSDSEKEYFVELTVAKSMQSLMRAIDGMGPEERRKFVEDGLRQIERGRTAEEMERARELSEDMLARITEEGMKAYFEEAGADTKLDLAPLMEAMDGVVKGLSGNQFDPSQ